MAGSNTEDRKYTNEWEADAGYLHEICSMRISTPSLNSAIDLPGLYSLQGRGKKYPLNDIYSSWALTQPRAKSPNPYGKKQ